MRSDLQMPSAQSPQHQEKQLSCLHLQNDRNFRKDSRKQRSIRSCLSMHVSLIDSKGTKHKRPIDHSR